ncbi:MBL fold metallo-hydrolase [Pseudalkalibacillus salsuginis]|uniref:MBL fold metallo-hydrolase n=1 Tax=Pseudalkalibacillus salsuginis TaxID=2910972 RepID=UPI001F2B7F33|nr:MBL fold metallo-hydrolase [Pseudalkalibacillus salsuginis]MCF6410047.1 MBL fold metallo-hydrolase [Pseudalkalibacillus salsuginis]
MSEVIHDNGRKIHPIIVPTRSDLGSFNFYLVEEEGSVSLIDAGINSAKCWDFFTESLGCKGLSLKDLDRIIITHNHEDHVGLVDRIVSKHDIPVYVPENSIHRLKRDKDFFRMRTEFFSQLYREMGCGEAGEKQVEKLKEALEDHDKKKVQADLTQIESDPINGLKPIQTPGHSPDHLVFLDEKRGWLFSGDLLIRHMSSNALVEPDHEGNRLPTLLQQEQSLEKCSSFDIQIAFSGHGVTIENPQNLIEVRLSGIKKKAEKVLNYVNNGTDTASKLGKTMYKGKYESQFSLVMSEVIGHLDYLEIHKKVEKEMNNGVWHYKAL